MAASMCLKLLAKTLDAWITIVKIAAPMIWLTSFGCSMRLTIMLNGAKKIESSPTHSIQLYMLSFTQVLKTT